MSDITSSEIANNIQVLEDDLYNNLTEESIKISPFLADLDPDTPPNPIGFMIPRPHRPPMDPEMHKLTIEKLKKYIETINDQ